MKATTYTKQHRAAKAHRAVEVRLLPMFRLEVDDVEVAVGGATQRLIAFLAVQDRWMRRLYVASMLWPDTSERRATTSLRSALSRLRAAQLDLVDSVADRLRLARWVELDLQRATAVARQLIAERDCDTASPAWNHAGPCDTELLHDLLPDWYEEWLLLPQERWRQLRVHALEALADALTRANRFAEALEVSLSAVEADHLRESAHRCVVRIHLAEGNWADAQRQYLHYRSLAREELGVDPSPLMLALVTRDRAGAKPGKSSADRAPIGDQL